MRIEGRRVDLSGVANAPAETILIDRSGILDVKDSGVFLSRTMLVGNGTASFTGGTLSQQGINLGADGGTQATLRLSGVTVSDGGASQILVGGRGTGNVEVDGAAVNAFRTVVGGASGGSGTILLANSSWSGSAPAGIPGVIIGDGGRGTVSMQGSTVDAALVRIGTTGAVMGSGALTGSLDSGGTIAPLGAGVTVAGDVNLTTTSRVVLTLSAAQASGIPLLTVNGKLSADGTLRMQMEEGQNWNPAASYALVRASELSGGFANAFDPLGQAVPSNYLTLENGTLFYRTPSVGLLSRNGVSQEGELYGPTGTTFNGPNTRELRRTSVQAVPEPNTVAGIGAALLLATRRLKGRRSS